MDIAIVTLAERPDLDQACNEMPDTWPDFMREDPMGWNMGSIRHLFPECQLIALEGDRVVAKGHSAPIPWSGDVDDLPDQGWDDICGRAVRSACGGRPATAVTALEITVDPARRGRGLSHVMLSAMRANALRRGFADLVAPVRPNGKHTEPLTPMAEYVARRRDDGLPVDAWLRVHVRLGGVIIKVCPAAMTVAGSLRQWRAWSGLPLDHDGDVIVPGALAPLHVALAHDRAVYVEPNVWVHHRLGDAVRAGMRPGSC
jgi:GNAT superfamily N-acetyltransferase